MASTTRHRAACTTILCFVSIVCGCRSAPVVDEYLDRGSGATITTAGTPAVFARTDARYSRSGRDYVYVGPVSINRQGLREYYLWIGFATTLDRGFLAAERPTPQRAHVVVDGEPMDFELSAWSAIRHGDAGVAEYETSVAIGSEWAARVTLDQVERIAGAAIETIHVTDVSGQQTYSSWARGDWSGFLGRERVTVFATERD